MAPREHDGWWEHAGTRPWDDEPDQEDAGGYENDPEGPGPAPDAFPADQWFGDGMLPPPPPYAQPAADQTAQPPAFPQPPLTPPPGPQQGNGASGTGPQAGEHPHHVPPEPAQEPPEEQENPALRDPAPPDSDLPEPEQLPPLEAFPQDTHHHEPSPRSDIATPAQAYGEHAPGAPAYPQEPQPPQWDAAQDPPQSAHAPEHGHTPGEAGGEQQVPGHTRPPQSGPYASPYTSGMPYPPGGQTGRSGGAQPPYGRPASGQPQQQNAPHGSQAAQAPGTAEPQSPSGPRQNPYRIPGYPSAPQTGPQPPPYTQGASGPSQGPPQGTQPPPRAPNALHGWPPQQPQPPAPQRFQYPSHFSGHQQAEQGRFETADALDAESLVRGRREEPSSGWRRVVRSATLGLVNPGLSAAEVRRQELTQRATTHVAGGHHRVAVLSLKGGVGKTTTTVALGSMLASLRGDRVLAVDANPDRGTLSDKVRLETAATIRDLLNERHQITRYADIRGFTSQSSSRLEILASDRDPAVSEAFSEEDYLEVTRLLEHYYSICITDCGTGLLHSAMRGVLGLADQIVLVSSASVDGARSASATLDWLEAHEYGYHVRGAVVVLSMVRENGKSSVDLDRLEEHFASRCRAVVRVPWDPHLEEGAEVDLERLTSPTSDAYLQLAATVGEAFAWPR